MAGQATVTIGDKQWQAYLTASYAELVSGLSGLSSIPPGGGMLFVLSQEQAVSVTTYGMLFPIDIIFISGQLQVTGVARAVSPGLLVTEDAHVRYFLEVNAGEAEGVEIGDAVNIALFQIAGASGVADWISPVVSLAGAVMVGAFMANMGKVMAGAIQVKPERPALYGPRGERLLQTLPAGEKLYQRGADGYPVGADKVMRDAWGPIPDPDQPFWSKDGFVKPARIYGWQFSPDYNRWRACVRFPDGTETWTSPSKQDAAKRPTRRDVSIGTWAERDRLGIWITDKRTGNTIAEWWDEDAGEMFEQGFFKPGHISHQGIDGRAFEESVLDYAESAGLLAGEGKYLPQTTSEAYYWTGVNQDTGEIVESQAPYTSSGRALRSGKAWASRRWRETALVEVWRQPTRYSRNLDMTPVASELVTVGQSGAVSHSALLRQPAITPTVSGQQPTCGSGGMEFLPDSPEFLAYTIDDIGYRDRLDSAFQAAIARAKKGARP